MLKIRDNVDLEELEKYGFFKIELTAFGKVTNTLYRKYTMTTYNDYDEALVQINVEDRIIMIFPQDFDDIKHLDVLYDLIKNDLVEKVQE